MSEILPGALTGAEIHYQIRNGEGAEGLAAVHQTLMELCKTINERASRVYALSRQIEETWQGKAGIAAAGSARSFADTAAHNVSDLLTATQAVDDQINAFGVVFNKVVPVDEQAPIPTKMEMLLISQEHNFLQKLEKWRAASQNNIDAFAEYHAISMDNGRVMPTGFQLTYTRGGDVNLEKPDSSGAGGDAKSPAELPHSRSGSLSSGDSNSSAAPTSNSNTGAGRGTSVSNGLPETTSHAALDETHAASNVSNSAFPMDSRLPWSSGNTDGVGGGSGGASGGSGFGVGSGGTPIPEQGAARNPGRTVGIGGPISEALSGSKGNLTGAAASKPGASGMPLGGAPGSAGKDEDREHQRAPFLQEADPDDIFLGGLEITTAPVIGETRRTNS